jgi:indole-3-glycerol phosphate synthase
VNGNSFLGRMAAASRERVKVARQRESEGILKIRALAQPAPQQLSLGEFSLIAELKLRSPAAGSLAIDDFDRNAQLQAYASGGAAAISVLTEPVEFKGSLTHLREAATAVSTHGVPTMRKDFLTDPYQVLEAKAEGAGGILVIITMLTDEEIDELLSCARECGLFVLLEAFDVEDLERIALLADRDSPISPLLCGVNCRNLKTLAVDFARFTSLAPHLPTTLTSVAESGIDTSADIQAIAKLGYRAALVGSALMRAENPASEAAAFIATGAEAVRCS